MNSDVIRREFRDQDILSASQFSREGLQELFSFAERMRPIARREVRSQVLGGYIMGSFFFKESTRTRICSEAAFLRLGGEVVTFTDMQYSSMAKGETFEDTIRTLDSYCDIMTLRLEEEGQAAQAAKIAQHPVINGGDGSGEHPTQGLLDTFTLDEAAKRILKKDISRDPFTLAIVGDLKYGRTAHSLVLALREFCDDIRFHFVAPQFLQLPAKLKNKVRSSNCEVLYTSDFLEGVSDADAIYMLRPQLERMKDEREKEAWAEVGDQYRLNRTVLKRSCKPNVLITHPGPRNAEIARDVDDLRTALYHTRQVENGIVIRMALSIFILGKENKFV